MAGNKGLFISLDIFHFKNQHGQIYSVHKLAGSNLIAVRIKFQSGKYKCICCAEKGRSVKGYSSTLKTNFIRGAGSGVSCVVLTDALD